MGNYSIEFTQQETVTRRYAMEVTDEMVQKFFSQHVKDLDKDDIQGLAIGHGRPTLVSDVTTSYGPISELTIEEN